MALTRYKILHKSGGNTTVNSGSSTNVSVNTSSGTEYFNRYFYWDAEHESVHCRYSLVGDYEVSAFGYGSSSGSGGGGGGGDVDLSDYVTYEFLSNQSYVTNTTLNNTLNSYVTEQELSDKGYVTSNTLNNYVTKSSLSQMGYITANDVSNMGYLTQTDVTNMGYVTQAYLNQQFAFTENQITALKNLVGNGEISAFGSGSSSGGGGEGTSVEVVDDLTHHSNADRYKALSAYQGYVLDKKIDELPTMSTLSAYVTQNQLDTAAYVTQQDLDYYVPLNVFNTTLTTSYVKKSDLNNTLTAYNTRISALEDDTYSYGNRLNDLEQYFTDFNSGYINLDEKVENLRQKVNSYINSYVPQIERLYAYYPILTYMQLCEDSNGNAYIKFTCPIVSTGEIEAYK